MDEQTAEVEVKSYTGRRAAELLKDFAALWEITPLADIHQLDARDAIWLALNEEIGLKGGHPIPYPGSWKKPRRLK